MSYFAVKSVNIVKVLLFLILLSIFFPIRHVFLTNQAYLSGGYSDFTSFSLYLSDILIITTWLVVLISRGRVFYHVVKGLKWLILWVILAFLVNFGLNKGLSVYLLARFLELIVAYGTFVVIIKEFELKSSIFKLVAWLCSLEALISIIQFARQRPLALFKLGEQHIGANILGIAKIVSGGTQYVRAYGTFPHPNPLSAVLLAGILVILYLLVNSSGLKDKITYSTLLFLNILGLTVTFSRGAYIALAAGLLIFFSLIWFYNYKQLLQDKRLWQNIALGFGVGVVSIVIAFVVYKPFLLTRATFSDQSTIDRKFYDVNGVKMIEKNPLFGLGLGESLLHMEQYSGKSLEPWDKQPPHNYFIIAAAEMGVPAALILLWVFLNHLWLLFKKIKFDPGFEPATRHLSLVTILLSFLLLMQFDHYFFTLEQTELFLWLLLALIAAETKNPQEGDLSV